MTSLISTNSRSTSHDSETPLEQLPILRTPHYGRWLCAAVVAIAGAQFIYGAATNPRFDWPTFAQFFFSTPVLEALWLTIRLTIAGAVLGFIGGVILTVMRLSPNPLLRASSWSFIWLFRSIPLIVQILFWGFLGALYTHVGYGIPFGPVFGETATKDLIGPMSAAVIGLSIHQAAYAAEIIRAGFLSVDEGQREAAAALGIPARRQFSRIIFPQAMRTIVPPATNEVIGLLKGTSAVFIIALPDLFYQVQVIYGRNGRIIPLLMVAVAWYVILTGLLSVIQFYVERHFAKGAHRELPPTPFQRARLRLREAAVSGRGRKAFPHLLTHRRIGQP